MKIKIYPTQQQKELLNEIIDVYRYVYNRAVYYIKYMGHDFYFEDLRDFLVTESTRKYSPFYSIKEETLKPVRKLIEKEKDEQQKEFLKETLKEYEKELNIALKEIKERKTGMIRGFELRVSKDIRSNAVKAVCDAYKTAISNLQAGNIKHFSINFKEKKALRQQAELASADISMKNGRFRICPKKLGAENCMFQISSKNRKKYGNIIIKNNCDLIKIRENYYIYLAVPYDIPVLDNERKYSPCGIDPGVRTFMNIYTPSGCSKILTCQNLYTIRGKINKLKEYKRTRKKHLLRLENKLSNTTDRMHWNTINTIISKHNMVLYGDIKSHSIVKNNQNSSLNSIVNDIKFYVFKQRLIYKCKKNNVIFIEVPEHYTTQTCSHCGFLHIGIGKNEVFNCPSCRSVFDRDFNASKNIYMKGLIL